MPPNNPSTPSAPPMATKKSRWVLYGCGTILGLLLVILATILITIWWIHRPIKPVVLSAPEKAEVEEKLRHLGGGKTSDSSRAAPETNAKPDRPYQPGSKVLKLTEREI